MKDLIVKCIKRTLPIFVSFLPVSIVYGVLMETNGYNFLWTGLTSMTVFAGSLQMLMIDFFTSSASYVTVAVMALVVNSRHIFYGIPFVEKWKDYGAWKYFLIFALPDEAFSLHILQDEEDEDKAKWMYIITAVLIYAYWVILSSLGGIIGKMITFNTDGLDFCITALIACIALNLLKHSKSPYPALVAIISSAVSILIFGTQYFILPSLIVTVFVLLVLRRRLEAKNAD